MSRPALVSAVLCCAALVLAQVRTAPALLSLSTDKENVQIVNQSLEFVKIIKEDLRRDNDDYSMLEQDRQPAAEQPPPPLRRSEHFPSPPPLPLNRNHIPSVRAPPSTPQPPAPISRAPPLGLPPELPDTRRGMNMTRNLTAVVPIRPAPNSSKFKSKVHAKHYKKVRVDKLKRLVDENRIRAAARTAATGTSPTPPPAAPLASVTPHPAPAPLSTRLARPARPTARASQSPSPDQLDMAPARGPQITLIRFKGRLCQRSVMRVEGPTYDRLGKTVRPAFSADKRGRQFHHTSAPKLLLPRCCNCCKKSVLGCQ